MLPDDLARRGWKLIERDGWLFAISQCWGCTTVQPTVAEVIRAARAMTGYIEWRMAREREMKETGK